MENILSQFDEILNLASEWAEAQEAKILQLGLPIDSRLLLSDGKKAGVAHIDKVRIYSVRLIPSPDNPLLREACSQINFIPSRMIGLTLGYGVYIKNSHQKDHALCLHELVHVAQYERFGSIKNFLKQYLFEIIQHGYSTAPLEIEAYRFVKSLYGSKT